MNALYRFVSPLRAFALAGTLTLGLTACGDDGASSPTDTLLDVNFDGIDVPDTTPDSNPSDTTNPTAVKVFEFKKPFGDDGNPCLNKPRCAIFIGYNEQLPLEMVYTEDGQPVMDKTVTFTVENDPNNLGRLNINSVVTDAAGVAKVTVSPRVNQVGQFAVKATMPGTDVTPKYFDVVISPKGLVPLTVVGTYNGQRQVGSYSVRLYKQTAAGEPKCTSIDLSLDPDTNNALPTANYGRDNILRQQTAKFPEFLGLDTDGTQKYSILAFSRNTGGAVQAIGCDSDNGTVSKNESKTVTVEMIDRQPTYVGSYEITSRFNFVSAIPEPYRTYVQYVLGFFQSPTTTLVQVACDLMQGDDPQLNGFCDALFDIDANGNVSPGTLGSFVFDLADTILSAVLDDTVFATILQGGGDVADILTAFDIQATLDFKKQPNAAGVFANGDVTETWHSIKVKWTLGQNCDPATEVGCGVRVFSMNAFQQQAVTGVVPATVEDEFELNIAQHPLNLRYGALINYFLEAFLLPLVTGQQSVDSYEELLGFLVGSGVQCLTPQVNEPDCCGKFATDISLTSGSASHSAVTAACRVIVDTAPDFLRSTLTNLDLSSGQTFNLGTKQACLLRDANDDLVIDQIGTQANPCQWNVVLKFSDTTQTTIDSTFWGARSE
jgi:hypothetical protein